MTLPQRRTPCCFLEGDRIHALGQGRAPAKVGARERSPTTGRHRQHSDKALDWKRSTTAGVHVMELFLGKKASALIPVVDVAVCLGTGRR